jgi:hypothetical protein
MPARRPHPSQPAPKRPVLHVSPTHDPQWWRPTQLVECTARAARRHPTTATSYSRVGKPPFLGDRGPLVGQCPPLANVMCTQCSPCECIRVCVSVRTYECPCVRACSVQIARVPRAQTRAVLAPVLVSGLSETEPPNNKAKAFAKANAPPGSRPCSFCSRLRAVAVSAHGRVTAPIHAPRRSWVVVGVCSLSETT